MKKGLFLALPALLLGVSGCKVLNQLKGLTEAFVEWEDDDTGKEVKKAALASSIESLNTRNYFLKYRAAETMAGKAILYEVDGWNVKVGPTYYDYSKAASEKVGYSYIQDSNGTWVKGTQDLNNEPWADSSMMRIKELGDLFPPIFSIQTTILYRFGEMFRLDVFRSCQVGYCA